MTVLDALQLMLNTHFVSSWLENALSVHWQLELVVHLEGQLLGLE